MFLSDEGSSAAVEIKKAAVLFKVLLVLAATVTITFLSRYTICESHVDFKRVVMLTLIFSTLIWQIKAESRAAFAVRKQVANATWNTADIWTVAAFG